MLPLAPPTIVIGDNTPHKIIDAFYHLSYQLWHPCRLLGQTIFTLTSNNELIFSACSLSTFMALGKLAVIGAALIWIGFIDGSIADLCAIIFGKVTKITYLCQSAQLYNSVVADLICLISMFRRKKDVANFHRAVMTFLVEINAGDVEMENATIKKLHEARKSVMYHQVLIFGSCAYQILGGFLMLFAVYRNPPPNFDFDLWRWYLPAVPFLAIIWAFIVMLRLVGRLYLVGTFRLLETCAEVIEVRLIKEIRAGRSPPKIPLMECLRRYGELEKLVGHMNRTFGTYLAADLLSLIVANVTFLFYLGVHISSYSWSTVFNSFILLVAHLDVTVVICGAAYRLERGAQKVTQLVQEFGAAGSLSNDDYYKV